MKYLPPSDDSASVAINVPIGFPFGNNTHTAVYVSIPNVMTTVMALLICGPKNKLFFASSKLLERIVVNFDLLPRVRV